MATKQWTTVDEGTEYERLHANLMDPKGPPSFEGGDACVICSHVDKRSKFVYWKGSAYCVKHGCYKDIEGLRQKARAMRMEE